MKADFKKKAISLRKSGFSYSEILKQVPVAKSTLSLWLRSVGLSKEQKQILTTKKLLASKRGGETQRQKRLKMVEEIRKKSLTEISSLIGDPLHIMGAMLYWAEGSKSKEYNPSEGFIFSNSDSAMINVILAWLQESLHISKNRIKFEIYIHEAHKNKVSVFIRHWAFVTGFPRVKFDKIYFKRHNSITGRKNVGESYNGQLRIKVSKSTNLNRQISGWIEGLCIYCGVV